ncbi:phosphoglucomutase [Algibacter lectus]|uniref:Phosphoglucomutase n=1 Tax=Algibacter lectus TaxID=221126 RepID=A0A090X4R2_9FLAO|nr:phosphoglucomutase [Algibacter lectus]
MIHIEPKILDRINAWLTPAFDEETQKTIKDSIANNPKDIQESFYKDLEFGTGGMRGIMGGLVQTVLTNIL